MEENLNMGGKYSTGVIGKKLTAIDKIDDLKRLVGDQALVIDTF